MPEHRNFAVALRLWDAIALGDISELEALLSEKSEWRMPGRSDLAGTYVGVDAILAFMVRPADLSEDLHSELIEVFASDSGAVLHYSVRAVRGSQRLDTEHLFMIRIEEGVITEGIFAPTDQAEYDRFFTLR